MKNFIQMYGPTNYGKVYVTIKSAPHNEEQMIKVDFDFINQIDESIKLDWRNYLFVFLISKLMI